MFPLVNKARTSKTVLQTAKNEAKIEGGTPPHIGRGRGAYTLYFEAASIAALLNAAILCGGSLLVPATD